MTVWCGGGFGARPEHSWVHREELCHPSSKHWMKNKRRLAAGSEELLSMERVSKLTGISMDWTCIRSRRKFPAPIKVDKASLRFMSEVQPWIANKVCAFRSKGASTGEFRRRRPDENPCARNHSLSSRQKHSLAKHEAAQENAIF